MPWIDLLTYPMNEKKLKMGKNSRQKIETEFDERIVIKKYLDALKEIM